MKAYQISTTFLFCFAACGGSELDPGAGDDPGTGTTTLAIDGTVSAEPRLANARSPGDFDTSFSVRVRTAAGDDITTGTVKITSASGTVQLVFDPSGDRRRWVATAAGYDEVYVLDVESGADNVHGVRVDGPDIHVFTAPLAGATVDSALPLEIRWSHEDEAESTSIRAEQLDNVAITDSGHYMLSAGALKAERDKAHENELRIVRLNRVTPAGATASSELSVSIRNHIQVVAAPNPAL